MPSAQHPQAKFDPIPPDLDLSSLVDRTSNFKWVQRVSRAQIRNLGPQEFEKLVAIHVIAGGKPLVIDGWDSALPTELFNVGWLEINYDKKQENVRDIANSTDIPMTTGHYLRSMRQLTNQWSPNTYRDERRQRLYLKDIDCPNEWRDALQRIIHPNLFYLNENVTTTGKTQLPNEIFQSKTTVATAGDLMSSLPEEMRAQNLMCYIGHEGTYTPAHREMCASLGQNIMVEASGNDHGEKPGSSIWFMTESKDREVVREYFLSMLGHDIEIEKHFAQINAWKKAPFDVYIVDQRAGDFVLIPPLAAHQVWNRGTRTMKVAWNRTTVETLELALHEALPKARLVCRDEQYKNKAIIYFTLQKYHKEFREMEEKSDMGQMTFMSLGQDMIRNSPRTKQLAADFKKLFGLYTQILVDEMFAFREKEVEFLPFDSCVTCSYCRSNIFNRFLTCKNCIRTLPNGEEDAYDVCMECYAMGRSCACLSGLQWCEQWLWSDLIDSYETWRATVIINDGFVDFNHSAQPLEIARQKAEKKSVAQICQEALRRRPWKDITKPEPEKAPSDSEGGEGDDKHPKKPKRKKKRGEVRRCHVCCHPDYSYRVHICTNPGCAEAYCYGVLYRAFDLMPQKVLEDEHWQCPKCLGICNCGHCRRAGNTKPYTPKNTSLGHDTRRIADDRSVEALVDFRIHNLSWLKAAGEESRSKDSKRMQRLQEQANNAKAQDLTEQVEAERKMQNDDAAVHDIHRRADHSPMANGYGEQSHIIDGDATNADPSFPRSCPVVRSDDHASSHIISATGMNRDNVSLYPDPSVYGSRRIGMGYYEQDDTPDKILFDPYQAPSAELLKLDEPDVPEFVKKSIRAAKRKARRDNEDPDFVMSKSHNKKPRFVAESANFLDSMDPALFAEGTASFSHGSLPSPELPSSNKTPGVSLEAHQKQGCPSSVKKLPMPRFDANEPALRHAKPRASYIEVDDLEVEDLEEIGQVSFQSCISPIEAVTQQKDQVNGTIDMEGRHVAKIGMGHSLDFSTEREPGEARNFSDYSIPRKRGRPPKRLSLPLSSCNTDNAKPQVASIDREMIKRARGRPRKSSLSASGKSNLQTLSGLSDDHSLISIKQVHKDSELGEMITHGVMENMSEMVVEKPTETSQRGPSRRSGVTTIAAGSLDHASPDEEHRESSVGSITGMVQRRKGRPRKSGPTPGSGLYNENSTSTRSQYMSMAERMALKGKAFRIGKRSTPDAKTPPSKAGQLNTNVSQSREEIVQEIRMREKREASASERWTIAANGAGGGPFSTSPMSRESRTSSPPPSHDGGTTSIPTIVRLVDASPSIDRLKGSHKSEDSTDEEDIPSNGQAYVADNTRGVSRALLQTGHGRRGKGRGRGRGRGRGGGRGRARGK